MLSIDEDSLGFIGYSKNYRSSPFGSYQTDSFINFIKNSQSQGENWEYKKINFDYKRNNFGHRSKEYSELNLDNYILCTGCSLVEGIGLPVEKRWSDVLAKKLNCDMYNLGLGGTGNDVIFYNLVNWFTNIEVKPKLVIIGWSSTDRFVTINRKFDNITKDSTIFQINTSQNEDVKDFIVDGEEINYFKTKTFLFKNLIRKIITLPIIEVPWMLESPNNPNVSEIKFDNNFVIDRARDLMHPGIKSNQKCAEVLFNYIKENKLL